MALDILAVGPPEIQAGSSLLRRFAEQDLTMADAVGLHLMTDRRCPSCWDHRD